MTTSQIDQKIQEIFKRNRIRAGKGEESFHLAIDRVEKKSPRDAARLRQLGSLWVRVANKEFSRGAL